MAGGTGRLTYPQLKGGWPMLAGRGSGPSADEARAESAALLAAWRAEEVGEVVR